MPSAMRKVTARPWSAITRSETSSRSVAAVAPPREPLRAGDDRRAARRCRSCRARSGAPRRCARSPCRCRRAWPAARESTPARVAVVLDEDEVPDLDVARAAAVHGAAVARLALVVAGRRAAVDVDLGARPARARLAHLPEVLLVEAEDALRGDVGHLGPERAPPRRRSCRRSRRAGPWAASRPRSAAPTPSRSPRACSSRRTTSCRASRRRCGGRCRVPPPRGRCACR